MKLDPLAFGEGIGMGAASLVDGVVGGECSIVHASNMDCSTT